MDNQVEIDALEVKLKAREGKPGYTTNVAELRERIAELKAQNEESE